jgi:hypothetical protein
MKKQFSKFFMGVIAVSLAIISLPVAALNSIVPAPTNYGVQMNGVAVEIWVDYIMGNLFKDNSFVNFCYNESQNVLGGSVVHIPQAGAKPTVVKNRNSYPATAVRRTDTDITYPLDVYTTDPTHIPKAETMEISYDKMGSVLDEHLESMSETIADHLLFSWAPTSSANILRTTGSAILAHLPSATGNRKKLVKEDLKRAQSLMNKQGIAKADRYALIPEDMYQQLTEDSTLMARDGVNGGELSLKDGVVLRLYGFNIISRATTVAYTNAGTPVPKAPGAAAAATDNDSVICWQKNAVAKAQGTVEFFENQKDPQYYGDIYSILVKMGGRKRRDLGEGVVAIVQDASA